MIEVNLGSTRSVLCASQVKLAPSSDRVIGCNVNLKCKRIVFLYIIHKNFINYWVSKYFNLNNYLFSMTSPALFSYSSSLMCPLISHLTIGSGLPVISKRIVLFLYFISNNIEKLGCSIGA